MTSVKFSPVLKATFGQITIEEVRKSKLWKNCIPQNVFKNDWWEDAYPSS